MAAEMVPDVRSSMICCSDEGSRASLHRRGVNIARIAKSAGASVSKAGEAAAYNCGRPIPARNQLRGNYRATHSGKPSWLMLSGGEIRVSESLPRSGWSGRSPANWILQTSQRNSNLSRIERRCPCSLCRAVVTDSASRTALQTESRGRYCSPALGKYWASTRDSRYAVLVLLPCL